MPLEYRTAAVFEQFFKAGGQWRLPIGRARLIRSQRGLDLLATKHQLRLSLTA
jgi:hypothetical protein